MKRCSPKPSSAKDCTPFLNFARGGVQEAVFMPCFTNPGLVKRVITKTGWGRGGGGRGVVAGGSQGVAGGGCGGPGGSGHCAASYILTSQEKVTCYQWRPPPKFGSACNFCGNGSDSPAGPTCLYVFVCTLRVIVVAGSPRRALSTDE